jgi:diacylglycerol kinase (ATP)
MEPSWKQTSLVKKIANCFQGLRLMGTEEESSSFKYVLGLVAIMQFLGLVYCDDLTRLITMFFISSMAPVAEIFNSAIEKTVDRISLKPNNLSRDAKDLASAASMWTQVTSIACSSLLIFWK